MSDTRAPTNLSATPKRHSDLASPPAFGASLGPRTIVTAVWDVLSAAAARAAGSTHLFLSGAAINNVHGYPDRGVLDMADISRTVTEITDAVRLPILVDAETGYGPPPRLTRLVHELLRAGASAVMIEDQDVTGQSKRTDAPALGDPDEMCRRIELIRSIAGDALGILARTDYLPGMDFGESLKRLNAYVEAGADWTMPVFAPSLDALREAAAAFPGRLVLLLAPGPWPDGPVLPRYEHIPELNPLAVLVTGQYRNAFMALRTSYDMSLRGSWTELLAGRPDPRKFDESLGLLRPGMHL